VFDTCGSVANVGECYVDATVGNPAATLSSLDSATLTSTAEVADGKLVLRNHLVQSSIDHMGADLFVFADYIIQGTLNLNSNILSLHPEIIGQTIPTINLNMSDDGFADHGPSLPAQDGGPNVVQSYYVYTRSVSLAYFAPVNGLATVTFSNQGSQGAANADPISNSGSVVRFDNDVPTFLPNVGNFQIFLHVGLQLSGDTYGFGSVDLDLTHTSSVDGLSLLTADGTDVTSAFNFSLDDGSPLFISSVPEPGTLLFAGCALLLFAAGIVRAQARRLA
jgi:hypothetical protein